MNQKLQLIHNWMFPEQPKVELETDIISNKKFMFMSIVGISLIVIMKVIFD